MGVYVPLGFRKAIWIEARRAWIKQNISIEKFKNEWVIKLPTIQLVYTG